VTHATILVGHVLDRLPELPSSHFHCAATSPPYWGLRNYGLEPQVWPARHGWTCDLFGVRHRWSTIDAHSAVCSECEAWLGSLGLEPDPDTYVFHLVQVFRAVARVLRRDATLWLNLGDTYTSGRRSYRAADKKYRAPDSLLTVDGGGRGREMDSRPTTPPGMKEKDLVGIPWMVAAALRDDGWFLRSEIVWAKPSPMPESVRDRPTRSHEQVFLLSRSASYFYDADAIREPFAGKTEHDRGGGKYAPPGQPTHSRSGKLRGSYNPGGRNKRDVWTIASKPFRGAHFATFPPALAELCILAGTSEGGCCGGCGAPLRRAWGGGEGPWQKSCRCVGADVVPCRVLDPFSGAGTTGLVSHRHGRDYVGLELGERFARMTHDRLARDGAEVEVRI
jgi:DNA modification methylase